jgi:hypothetical protein
MQLYRVTGSVAIINRELPLNIDTNIKAMTPTDAYLAVAGEVAEQGDLFAPIVNLPGEVFFCGMYAGNARWLCPLTGCEICVVKA